MNVNEIRIGNWVNLEFIGPFQWEYTHFDEYVKDSAHGYDVDGCIISDKIEPIPLTPEILEKCGWMWNEECNSFEKYPNGDARMNLQRKFNGGYTMFNYVIQALICENIWHLHELQNLYFALTGEELEIDL